MNGVRGTGMKSFRLVGAGLAEDGPPIFEFETQLHEGRDLDGKFNIQFAAVKQDGDVHFAVNSPAGLLAIFDHDDSRRVARALAERGEYKIHANYSNKSWEEPSGYSMILMGRELGGNVDYIEQYSLEGRDYDAILEIAEVLGVPLDDER